MNILPDKVGQALSPANVRSRPHPQGGYSLPSNGRARGSQAVDCCFQMKLSRRSVLAGCASLLSGAPAPADSQQQRIEVLLRRLTLEEKVRLCHGNVTSDKVELFKAGGVPRLGIGQIRMLDGRQGIRPMDDKTRTTSLPCTLSLSCTWDTETAAAFGRLLAEELLAMDQHVLLAPCMNLMRSPLGGRNFENLGEDPYLAGRVAAAYIQGAQQSGIWKLGSAAGAAPKRRSCWAMVRNGSGTSPHYTSPAQFRLSIFFTPANTCGAWRANCIQTKRPSSDAG